MSQNTLTQKALRPSGWLILEQSIKSIVRRPGRALATATGIALGIAVLITSMGFASTVNSEVNASFDATSATQIRVKEADNLATDGLFAPFLEGATFDHTVGELEGVVAAGLIWQVLPEVRVRLNPAAPEYGFPLLVASPGILDAAQATLKSGRFYDERPLDIRTPQVVLGPRAASELGLERVAPGMSIEVDNRLMVVAGILDSPGTAPELSPAILISATTANQLGGTYADRNLEGAIVRSELGAAQAVSRALPLAIRPDNPQRVGLMVPPDITTLRDTVQGSLNGLAIGVAGFSVVVGAVGIMNSMLISVAQRSGEIGLRRALGATRRWILVQFLAEGLILGFVGAVFGAAIAILALLGVSAYNGWSPVLDPALPLAAPLVGAVVGLLAAAYPASRAARLEPAMTLKQ